MKLQKHKARDYKGKPIYKWTIVIPPEDIKKLNWKQGQELVGKVINNQQYLIKEK